MSVALVSGAKQILPAKKMNEATGGIRVNPTNPLSPGVAEQRIAKSPGA